MKKKPGAPPGTLVYEGSEPLSPVHIQLFDFGAGEFATREVDDLSVLGAYRDSGTTTWIDVDGVHDVAIIEQIGKAFDIHPLTLEDIVSPDQRPKVEDYEHYTYVVLQMMHYDHERIELVTEQVSLIVTDRVIISFQESIEGDAFDPVRDRLREGKGSIRSRGPDYLLYALIDLIVDYYMVVLEGVGEHIDDVESEVLTDPSPAMMRRISHIRQQMSRMRKSIWPLRDVVLSLERVERRYVSSETHVFFRDVYDHAVRTIEIIETEREVLATVTDLHVSTLSFRMNEIMKVLAIIATFFLPLTFIAGVYGMNFNTETSPLNMPELNWYFGYPFSLVLMVLVAVGMFVYFRRKGWL